VKNQALVNQCDLHLRVERLRTICSGNKGLKTGGKISPQEIKKWGFSVEYSVGTGNRDAEKWRTGDKHTSVFLIVKSHGGSRLIVHTTRN